METDPCSVGLIICLVEEMENKRYCRRKDGEETQMSEYGKGEGGEGER